MKLLNIFKSKKDKEASDQTSDMPTPDGKHNIQAPSNDTAPEDTSGQTPTENTKPSEPIDVEAVEKEIIKAFKTVYDPEIPVDIYELGLIYEIKIEPDGNTYVKMTLTAPNCPAAGILPGQIESAARGVDGVYDVKLDLVFDPPWGPDRMSEAAKLELGML